MSQKVKATFLLSGWTKEEQPQHVVRVVEGSRLEAVKGSLDTITAMHVYSVQPGVPKVSVHAQGFGSRGVNLFLPTYCFSL